MKEGADKVYYLIAESDAAARQSPHLEAFRERGIEVLLLSDRVDEWWMSFAGEFDGKTFQDVARGELDLGEPEATEKDEDEPEVEDEEPLLKRFKDALGDQVESVRRSTRLTDSPACLVLGEHDMGAQMRRIMEATGQSAPESKPHLEVNLRHPLIGHLNREVDEDRFADLVAIIFDQASLAEGQHGRRAGPIRAAREQAAPRPAGVGSSGFQPVCPWSAGWSVFRVASGQYHN